MFLINSFGYADLGNDVIFSIFGSRWDSFSVIATPTLGTFFPPVPGTLDLLTVNSDGPAPGGDAAYGIWVNGSGSSVLVDIPAGQFSGQDSTNSVHVLTTDTVTGFCYVPMTGNQVISVRFTPDP